MVIGDGMGCTTLSVVCLRGFCHVADERYLARNRNSGQCDREHNHGKRCQEVANAIVDDYSRRMSASRRVNFVGGVDRAQLVALIIFAIPCEFVGCMR